MMIRILFVLLFVITFCRSVYSTEATTTSSTPVVICAWNSTGPWKLIEKGVLRRSETDNSTDFSVKTSKHSFSWTITSNLGKSITITDPGSLTKKLFPKSAEPLKNPRGPIVVRPDIDAVPNQSIDTSGEIRERSDAIAIILTPGSTCPTEKPSW